MLVALALFAGLAGCQSTPRGAAEPEAPELVVLLVVDQLGADLLDRYESLYTGGFRRLLDQGYAFENATHDHAITHTAAGHMTLSTGVYPSRHGVVANTWFERDGAGWRSVYSVEDPDHEILGYPELPGRSPANGRRPGLADWVVGRDPTARVVSISRKDRAAIGLAAQAHGEVYWLADEGGEFITSDFYHDAYPEWVAEFNANEMPRLYAQTVWEQEVPAGIRAASRPDTSRFEFYGENTFFPHRPSEMVDPAAPGALNHWRYEYTPFPDQAVLAFARTAVDELDLGQRGTVDYLGLSLSQTDLIGHHFGPGSREQLDNLLRLDRSLGDFLAFLDEAVGRGRWVLAMSSDHGVLDIPEQLAAEGVEAVRLTRANRAELVEALQTANGGAPVDETSAKAAVLRLPFVEAAYTFDEIERGPPADSFAVLYAHSHSRERVVGLESRFGVYTRYHENVLEWTSLPATHGSPYYYDRHVPLVFLGSAVRAGASAERVATVDVAPTLARLTGVPAPSDLDGRVLRSVLPR